MIDPAALLPKIALDAGARLEIVNAEPTPYDDRAAAILRGSISAKSSPPSSLKRGAHDLRPKVVWLREPIAIHVRREC